MKYVMSPSENPAVNPAIISVVNHVLNPSLHQTANPEMWTSRTLRRIMLYHVEHSPGSPSNNTAMIAAENLL